MGGFGAGSIRRHKSEHSFRFGEQDLGVLVAIACLQKLGALNLRRGCAHLSTFATVQDQTARLFRRIEDFGFTDNRILLEEATEGWNG
jgi:hypothetical protein